jgi:hypothetical protein
VQVFADDLQGEVEGVLDVLVVEAETLDQGFGGVALRFEPLLLVVEELAGDAVFVVHVQQLSFLLFDCCKHTLAALNTNAWPSAPKRTSTQGKYRRTTAARVL